MKQPAVTLDISQMRQPALTQTTLILPPYLSQYYVYVYHNSTARPCDNYATVG